MVRDRIRARIVGIFCIVISCKIPRRYRDIITEFHGPVSGSATSCSSSKSARKLTTSVCPFLLLHGGCSANCLSVCSTSSYTAQRFVPMCNWSLSESRYCSTTISLCQDNATIQSCCEVCYDIIGHDHTIRALDPMVSLSCRVRAEDALHVTATDTIGQSSLPMTL